MVEAQPIVQSEPTEEVEETEIIEIEPLDLGSLGRPQRRRLVPQRVRSQGRQRVAEAQPTTQSAPTEEAEDTDETEPLDLDSLGIAKSAAPASEAAAPPPSGGGYSDLLKMFSPVAASLLNTSADEDVEVLKAKIKNQKNLRDTFPEPFKTLYANQVRVMEAKLRAAIRAKKDEAQTQASRWEWAALGKTGVVVGIVVGAAAVALLLAMARKQARKAE